MASQETTLKWVFPSATVVILILFMPVLCSTFKVNCSKPDTPSLLAALGPVFDLRAIRPVLNQRTTTNITVYFTLYGILGVDEKSQLLITYLWLHYWWMSEFISWDPVQCGMDKISLPKEKFWLPDIVINEFMEENKAPSVPYIYLYSDARVHQALPVRVVSSCNLDIYTFPFDIQNCSLTFNSYMYYAMEIKIFPGRDPDIITASSKNVMTTRGEWELLDISAQKLVNNDESGLYIDMVAFYIRVRRRSTMYVVTLLLPSCFLITLDLFSFLLPPQSTDRASFKMTLILGYTVFLLIMNDLLPITGNTIPLINPEKTNNCDVKPTTTGGSVVEDKALQELMSLSHVLQAIRSEVEQQQQKGNQSSWEWMQLGFIVDRLLFGLYIVFISVSFITIIIVWVNASNQ